MHLKFVKMKFCNLKVILLYNLIKNVIIGFVCRILFRVKYENLDVLNKYDKCLICPNHSRIFDPVFLYPKIDNMYSVAKSELFKNKFVSNFLSYYNAIPIKRNGKDFAGTMRILRLLKKHDKNKTSLPIIPVYITSRPRFFSTVTVKFGEPFIPKVNASHNKDLMKKETFNLINSIYELKTS